jgi:DHA2 family multidrug resistance protein
LINFRLLGRRNFGLGTLANFLLGLALYASAYLLPQYLAVTQGFDSEQAGEVMAWTGLPQLLVIPLVPLLMKRVDPRLLVGAGLLIFAVSSFMNLYLDQNYAAPQLFWPNIVRALGQAIVMTPISAIAMVGIGPAEAGAASGLFNMMRNLGGAIGTAAVETFFTKREQFHSAIINEHVSLLQPTVELDKAPSIDVSAELPSAPVPPQRKSRGHRGGLRLAVYSVLAVLLILFSAGWAAISLGIIRITIQ